MSALQTIIDYAALLSFIALATDILFQIHRIYTRKSSLDVSLRGLSIRLMAATVLLIKFYTTNDFFLFVGQGIFLTTFITYITLVAYYRKPRSNNA